MRKIKSLSDIVVESYGERVIKAEVVLDEVITWLKLGIGVDIQI